MCVCYSAVLTVQFESATYTAPENRVLTAGLVLSGGTTSSSIIVAVTPSEQSPASAEGDPWMSHLFSY